MLDRKKIFSLDQVPQAHECLESSHSFGKVVVLVNEDSLVHRYAVMSDKIEKIIVM